MADEKLSYDEFVEPNLLEPLRSEIELTDEAVKKFEGTLQELAKYLQKGLGVQFDPKTNEEIRQHAELIQRVNDLEKKNTELKEAAKKKTKEYTAEDAKAAIQKQQKIKLLKEEAKEQLGLIGAYQKASQTLNLLRNEYKNLEIQGKANTPVAKQLLEVITEQDAKLKKLDATVGQHQRNVGNYSGAIQVLARGLGGLTGLIGGVAAAFGMDSEMLMRVHEVSKELIKTSRELHHATELQELAHEKNAAAVEGETGATILNTEAAEENIAVTEEETAVQTASIGPLGLIIAGVAAVGIGIMAMVGAKKENIKYTDEEIRQLQKELELYREKSRMSKEEKDFLKEKESLQKDLQKGENNAIKDLQEEAEKTKEQIELDKQFQEQDQDNLKRKIDLRKAQGADDEELYGLEQELRKKELADMITNQKTEGQLAMTDFALQKQIADKKNEILVAQAEYQHKIKEQEEKDMVEWQKKIEEINNKLREWTKGWDQMGEVKLKHVDEEDHSDEIAKRRIDALLKAKEDAEKLRKERIDQAYKTAKEELEIYKEMQEKKIALEQDQLDRKQKEIDQALQIQANRAALGLQNTYDSELKAKAKANEEQAKLDKKRKKEAEAIKIEEIFLEFTKAFAKDGFKGLGEAAAATGATEGMMALIGSGLYEGTESVGVQHSILRLPRSKDNLLVPLHENERVIGYEDSMRLRGLSNEDLVQAGENYLNGYEYPDLDVPVSLQGHDATLLRMMAMHEDRIVGAIEKMKPTNIDWNKFNELTETSFKGANKIVKVYKSLGR